MPSLPAAYCPMSHANVDMTHSYLSAAKTPEAFAGGFWYSLISFAGGKVCVFLAIT